MRKTLLAAAVAASFAAPVAVTTAQAQQAAAPASPHTFTGNVAVVSDYRFRGVSQTYLAPAIQGGFDYSHSSGFYIGNWNSSVSGNSYNNGAGVEMDFYGGWKGSWGDWGLDVGGLYYYYPESYYQAGFGAGFGKKKYDNFELYIGGSWKWLSAKYSYATTDYFGLNSQAVNGVLAGAINAANTTGCAVATPCNSKGSSYLEINASYEVAPKWTLTGHVGSLKVKNWGGLNYTDWKIGVSYDAGWAVIGAAYVGTNAKTDFYRLGPLGGGVGAGTKDPHKDTLVLSISKSF